jgi:hypothetical protein
MRPTGLAVRGKGRKDRVYTNKFCIDATPFFGIPFFGVDTRKWIFGSIYDFRQTFYGFGCKASINE